MRRRAGWPERQRGRCGRCLEGGTWRRRRSGAERGQEIMGNQGRRRLGMADSERIHTFFLSPPTHRTRGWFLSTHSRVACSSVGRNNVMLCYVMNPTTPHGSRQPFLSLTRRLHPLPLGLQLTYTTGVHTLSHLRANAGTPTPAAVHRGEAGRTRWAALAHYVRLMSGAHTS